jgi:hypothetical protein
LHEVVGALDAGGADTPSRVGVDLCPNTEDEGPHSPPAAPRTSEFELSGFDIGVAGQFVGNAGSLYATLARLQLREFSVLG